MAPQINEADWEVFRELRVNALERFCQRVLSEVSLLAGETARGSHDRYLEIFQLLHNRDKQLADAFNDPRRSTAFSQLLHMRYQGLLTDEEFARFSPETRAKVESLIKPDDRSPARS